MRIPPALLAVSWFALGPLAATAAEAAQPAVRLQVQLVSPALEAVLPAGGALDFAWDFTAMPPAGVTEWELFLSLDDGRSYPFRLTPHLDLERRRVTVRLPETPTLTARFLLRVGNERDEVGIELGDSFEIAPSAFPAEFRPIPTVLTRGESARPGSAGVTRWVEGGRDGAGWREVTRRPEPTLNSGFTPGVLDLGGSIPPRQPAPHSLIDIRLAASTQLPLRPRAHGHVPPPPGRPLFLLLRRANC